MELINLIDRYKSLGIDEVINHQKFSHIAIVHHSTKIEGSTLTELETQVLLDEGLTPKGKPLHHSLMVSDHYMALNFVLEQAQNKNPVTVEFIQQINAGVLKNTGSIYNTLFGQIDAKTGAFRKGNVVAGNTYFPNFDKVELLTQQMTNQINASLNQPLTQLQQIYLSFDAHFNLVSIHPFYDGNGRTSRLLMNYIQGYYGLPLAIVFSEAKTEYIQALTETREKDNIEIFRSFMYGQYAQLLLQEIEKFEAMKSPKKGSGFTPMF
jgi:Fic family protein